MGREKQRHGLKCPPPPTLHYYRTSGSRVTAPLDTCSANFGTQAQIYTVCPRSSDTLYIVNYYIKWVTTSWTHSGITIEIVGIEGQRRWSEAYLRC